MKKLFFFVLVVGFTSCNNCISLDFALPVRIVNPQVEYHLGDTIRVQSKFGRMVKGIVGLSHVRDVDMGGIQWYPYTLVSRIDTLYQDYPYYHPSLVGSAFDFIENPNMAYYAAGDTVDVLLTGEYTYANDTFLLEYALVAQKVGTYLLHQLTALELKGSQQDFPGKCGRNPFFVEYYMNNEFGTYTGNNLGLLLESPNPYYNNAMYYDNVDRFYRHGGYCFRVVP
jgi:hypothetical protein